MSMDQLLAVMRRLRDPQGGCAWDLEQTMRSIVPHTLEEAYEVADAIERDDTTAVRDELGDLLYQVVFLARIAEEAGQLVRRHPHVFGETQNLSAEQQTLAWEGYKQTERAEAGEQGTLDGVALALPALTRAVKLGKRAARVHFDWPDASHMRAKLDEELAEFEETLRERESVERQSEELGDLLFVVANWARHLKLDPEVALRRPTLSSRAASDAWSHLRATAVWSSSNWTSMPGKLCGRKRKSRRKPLKRPPKRHRIDGL
jgi:ATP diphosphatase